MPKYRGCFVPSCKNTLLNSPKKTFVNVPKVKEIRELWFRAVGRETRETSSTYLACEDHFNFENDMDNYMEFRLTGAQIRMKRTALPHLMLGDNNSETSQKMQVCLVNKITEADQIDYNQACRCCLLKSDDMKSFYDLYATDMRVSEVFKSTTSLEFSSDQDSLPTQICHVCFCELNLSYKFVLKCRESDKKLRKHLDTKDTNKRKITKPISLSEKTQNALGLKSNLYTNTPIISFAHVDIKAEIDEFDPLSDKPINIKKIKLNSQTNNAKSLNDHTILESNFECVNVIDETENDLQLDILKHEIKDDLITEDGDLNAKTDATPIYELQSDEIFKQLQQSNRNELEQDVTAGTSESGKKRLNTNAKIEQKLNIRKLRINQLGIKESDTSEIIKKQDYSKITTGDIDSDEALYTCLVCDKSFKRKITLTDHLKTHTVDKLYACTLCDKTFNHLSVKNIHMRTHTGENPYFCTRCDESFNQTVHLSTHMLSHTDERPQSCASCEKSFRRKFALTTHMKTHTDKQLYSCKLCDKTFNRKEFITRHMLTHTEKTQ